jgi:hypothetical protein
MTTELVTIEQSVVSAISNPDVDPAKLHSLLDFQLRMMDKKAEILFNEAMARLQPKLPVIEKKGAITYGGKSQPYAKYEDIFAEINPLLHEEGFSFEFDSEEVEKGTRYSGTLNHSGGHSKTKYTPPLPADSSGGKNAIQALGSTVSYAKRYLVGMLLNLITKNEDDDAQMIGEINDEQILELEKLIVDTNSKKDGFLKFLGVNKLAEIQARDYQKAVTLLKQKGSKNK